MYSQRIWNLLVSCTLAVALMSSFSSSEESLQFQGTRNMTGDVFKECQQDLSGTVNGGCMCRDDKAFFHVLGNESYGCTTFKLVCKGKN